MSVANWTDERLIQRVKEGFDNSADDKFLCYRICDELAIRYAKLLEISTHALDKLQNQIDNNQ